MNDEVCLARWVFVRSMFTLFIKFVGDELRRRIARRDRVVTGNLGSCTVDFFFQAEDGIRDVAVTGVQTCALPDLAHVMLRMGLYFAAVLLPAQLVFGHYNGDYIHHYQPAKFAAIEGRWHDEQPASEEIGRASCRERV